MFFLSEFGHQAYQFDGSGQFQKALGKLGRGAGKLFRPTDLAVIEEGKVFTLDVYGRIEGFTLNGKFLGKRKLNNVNGIPRGIAAHNRKRVYVATDNHRVVVYAY